MRVSVVADALPATGASGADVEALADDIGSRLRESGQVGAVDVTIGQAPGSEGEDGQLIAECTIVKLIPVSGLRRTLVAVTLGLAAMVSELAVAEVHVVLRKAVTHRIVGSAVASASSSVATTRQVLDDVAAKAVEFIVAEG